MFMEFKTFLKPLGMFQPTPTVMTVQDPLVERKAKESGPSTTAIGDAEAGIFKSLSPDYLWNPPYGRPRTDDVVLERKLCKNAYIFSIVSTLSDEVANTEYGIVVKKQYMKDGAPTGDFESAKQKIMEFFDNPNGNEESFNQLLKKVTTDILEIESGVFVKVFNSKGEFVQLMAADGATFLKNPDIYGYYGNRDEFIPFYSIQYDPKSRTYVSVPNFQKPEDLTQFNVKDRAAYFQYGQNIGFPIPFGRREIVYISRNARTDVTYARPPVAILGDVLYTLIYGSAYNNAYYVNNNLPDGVLEMIGNTKDQMESFKRQYENNFIVKDGFGNKVKKFFKLHITNVPTKFTPFMVDPQVMQILEQQSWFLKLVWACFQITPDELGFTDSTGSKNVSDSQNVVHKRKAIEPLLRLIEYHINTQIIPEFGVKELEFKFKSFDLDEEIKKQQLYQLQLSNNLVTPNELRQAEGKPPLTDGDKTNMERQKESQEQGAFPDFSKKKPEEKSLAKEEDALAVPIEEFYDDLSKRISAVIEDLDRDMLGKIR